MAIEKQTESNPKAETILDAAERLLVRYGYRKSSMDDVAREAGTAKGTVYLYYAGKEALFRALLERIGNTVLQASELAAAAPHPFAERLFGVLNALYGYFYERFSESGHLQELGEIRGSLGQDLNEQLRLKHLQILVGVLEQAEKEGDISLAARGLTAQDVAATLIAAAIGVKTTLPAGAGIKAYTEAVRRASQVLSLALAK
jgi:AcrR family transcriptional regulator